MLFRLSMLLSATTLLLVGTVDSARAQDEEQPPQPSFSRLINIDALIDNHARFLARKYNLSDEQDEFTQQFLKLKADEFLDEHRELAYELIDELFAVRSGADVTTEQLIDWGKRALPLYVEAKDLIVAGNDEWREILTPEQRIIHDEDLRLMYQSFETTEDQLARIIAGEMTIEEFRRGPEAPRPQRDSQQIEPMPESDPPQPAPDVRRPPTNEPKKRREPKATRVNPIRRPGPAESGETDRPDRNRSRRHGRSSRKATDFESQWETYVREFISKYQLDKGQTQRAQTILKDCQERAGRIMTKRKPEMDKLDQKLFELGLSKKKDKLEELARIREHKTKLMEPIDQIFERQLKPRLDKLPTRAQRKAAEKAPKKASRKPQLAKKPKPVPQPKPEPKDDKAEPESDEQTKD